MKIAGSGVAAINASWSSDIGYSCRGYVGTKGTAFLRGNGQFDLEEVVYKTDEMPYPITETYRDLYDYTLSDGMAAAHKHFQTALETGTPIRTPLTSGVEALKVSLAALKSNSEHIVVDLPGGD